MHTVCAVAQNRTTLFIDGLFQRVIDFLPVFFVGLAEMNGLGIDNRLITVGTHVEVLHHFFALLDELIADSANEQLLHVLSLHTLGHGYEGLFFHVHFLLFHVQVSFLLIRSWGMLT